MIAGSYRTIFCTIYDIGEENSRPFMPWSFGRGQMLKDCIAAGRSL